MSEFNDIIKKYIQVSQPLIYIRGNDELRVKEELDNCCKSLSKDFEYIDYIDLEIETGSLSQGIVNLFNENHDKNIVIFISNGTSILREPEIIAFISKIATEDLNINIVVMSDAVDIPNVLNPYAVTLNLPAQTTEEIIEYLKKEGFRGNQNEFAKSLKGLSCFEIRQLVRRANKGEALKEITNKLNEGACSNNEFLSFVDVSDKYEIGGFSKLIERINSEKNIFKNIEDSIAKKTPIPKGFMLVGIPGCGKSLAAKVTAKEFGIPLLKMEFGKIMNKYVGESESNLFFALRFAEEYAPCVLWLDEFEKSIVSSSDGGSDGNISNRLLGIFLNWLQEKTAPVYVVATVNNIDKMPTELLRRGRFDEIYKVELPKPSARFDIMQKQLKKYEIEYPENENNMKKFCYSLDGYSGADIEELVKEVKKQAYCNNEQITEKSFKQAKDKIQSIENTMHKQTEKIRDVFETYNFKDVD